MRAGHAKRWGRGLLLSVALLSLASDAPAAAMWTPPPTDQAGMLARYLPVARSVWPESQCSGRESVEVSANVEVATLDETYGPSLARAAPASCVVWMRSIPTPEEFCSVLVHELGHLAGYGHTGTDEPQAPAGTPADAMRPVAVLQLAVCMQAIQPAPGDARGRAAWWLWNALPGGTDGKWRITCAHGACRATTDGWAKPRIYDYTSTGHPLRRLTRRAPQRRLRGS